ncbi:MAG: TonB-dependent receptor [Bacteroidales bacterium]|nr:TonB-dependent receptor [Bacteroidales bacterium]
MKISKYLVVCIALLFFFSLSAATLQGRIVDSQNEKGIETGSIYFIGSGEGTISDINGVFSLETPETGNDTLLIKVIGYENKKVLLHFPVKNILEIELETQILSFKDKVIVTATRRAITLDKATVSLDVIEREKINGSGAHNIAELLESVGSLQIRDYGGVGNMKTISLRGTSAGHTLLMLDGQQINNSQNGEVDLSLISLDNIERIEIVRGGSSAIYGSDAIGGVIHILTREADKNNIFDLKVRQTLASFNTYSIESSISSSISNFSILSTYQYLKSQSDFSYINSMGIVEKRENNDVTRHHLYTQIKFNPQKLLKRGYLQLNYNYINSDRGAPGTITYPFPYARMQDEQHNIHFKYSNNSNDLRHKLQAQIYYSFNNNHYINEHPTDVLFPSNDRYINEAIGSEIQFTSVFMPQLILNYGISVRGDIFNNLGLGEKYNRLSYAAYIVDESVFKFTSPLISSLKITPSLRYNGNNKFIDNLSPKMGLLINLGLAGNLSIKGNIGYNYRIPTFNDLYWPADTYTIGNPLLQPEYGMDWDAGFRFNNEYLSFESMYFNQKLTNLITWQAQDWVWSPQNIAEARINGIENALNIQLLNKMVQFSANYTFMNALDLTNSSLGNITQLTYRPQHSADLTIGINYHKASFRFKTSINGKRYTDAANTEETALPTYILNSMILRYQWNTKMIKLDGILEINNLFDVSYSMMKDMPMPGREVRFTLSGSLFKIK